VIVEGRWCWTADHKRLVLEGDPDAAFLAYPSGQWVSDEEAHRVGLIKPEVAEVVTRKAVRKPADKMMPAPSDK
jgi:hypothetical protein